MRYGEEKQNPNQKKHQNVDDCEEGIRKWEIIKEFNLVQEFSTTEVELLAQDSSVQTKKA